MFVQKQACMEFLSFRNLMGTYAFAYVRMPKDYSLYFLHDFSSSFNWFYL